ncbi:hypothetical protein Q31a_19400 [Aureliella helgolandensis]|uniref:Uncharacterized protein n=1 Tax=Aureliella helgolandensis TaxID=2527968 RepID=A0A518G4V7_9BACT|nr:hypothetical protein Q31a_19400 [Aureliella helgolandensis]
MALNALPQPLTLDRRGRLQEIGWDGRRGFPKHLPGRGQARAQSQVVRQGPGREEVLQSTSDSLGTLFARSLSVQSTLNTYTQFYGDGNG